ncbi:hypothetical protein NDU88_005576 [Pleurodeles waltl]|uniref:Secreted protein n=1 Tax=Pleurodeles waltl TaxID=8319 RepID=A0AAV7TBE4_PLEWA|nr:hypothetical protein NDU88_005576 [Pleurodeles waltl]
MSLLKRISCYVYACCLATLPHTLGSSNVDVDDEIVQCSRQFSNVLLTVDIPDGPGGSSVNLNTERKKKKNAINSSSRQEERLTRGAGLGALHNPSLSPSLFPGVSPPNLFLVTTRGPLYGRGDPLARRSNCGTAPALSASFPGQGSQVACLVRVSRPMGVRGQRFNRPPCSPSLLSVVCLAS